MPPTPDWRIPYESAKKALFKMYFAASTDAQRDVIEAKQFELIRANQQYLFEQLDSRAAEMRTLIDSLNSVIQLDSAGKITAAAKQLGTALNIWRAAVGADPLDDT